MTSVTAGWPRVPETLGPWSVPQNYFSDHSFSSSAQAALTVCTASALCCLCPLLSLPQPLSGTLSYSPIVIPTVTAGAIPLKVTYSSFVWLAWPTLLLIKIKSRQEKTTSDELFSGLNVATLPHRRVGCLVVGLRSVSNSLLILRERVWQGCLQPWCQSLIQIKNCVCNHHSIVLCAREGPHLHQ